MKIDIRKTDKKFEYSPDIAGVANLEGGNNPGRIYVFKENLSMYRGLIKAVEYAAERLQIIPNRRINYIIAFVTGIIYEDGRKDKDLHVFPFQKSGRGGLVKATPMIIKNGVQMPWKGNIWGDFGMLLRDEELHRRKQPSLERYLSHFPKLTLNKYIKE